MSEFKKVFQETLKSMGGVQGTNDADLYTEQVQNRISEAMLALRHKAEHLEKVDEKWLKGWLAEQWHAETLKISATAKGRNDIWANVAGSNITGEDIIYGNATSSQTAEVKFYKDPMATAKGISRPEYATGEKVVPGDQIDLVREAAKSRAEKIESYRPEQAEQLLDTAARAKDHIEVEDITSKPLSDIDAREMAKDFKKNGKIDAEKYGLNSENYVEWSDIARQSGEAALTAAALSAALSAAPHVWELIQSYIKNEKTDPEDLFKNGAATVESAAAAGLRGGIAAALTAACKTGLMGKSLKSISPAAIGIATTMTFNVVSYSIQFQRGLISQGEFVNHCMKDTYILSAATGGAAIGQILIPVPMLGALLGNIIGATIGAMVYEGTNKVILGLSIDKGWTFFGMVEQNYSVPETILKQCGYELISLEEFEITAFPIEKFTVEEFNPHYFGGGKLNFTKLNRGVISGNVIGYV